MKLLQIIFYQVWHKFHQNLLTKILWQLVQKRFIVLYIIHMYMDKVGLGNNLPSSNYPVQCFLITFLQLLVYYFLKI